MLCVNEIFRSIQGESTRAGLSCLFIRLQGCNLACSFCDTPRARHRDEGGTLMTVEEIVQRVNEEQFFSLVEVTGGEPLIQAETPLLLERLAEILCVPLLVETNGSVKLPAERHYTVVMDYKCPSSGESEKIKAVNGQLLKKGDEVKFVISERQDFDWMLARVQEENFAGRGIPILIAPAAGVCSLSILGKWILETDLPLRLQPQLQKIIDCR